MTIKACLISILVSLVSGSLVWLTKRVQPTVSALWAGMHPFSVGDTVSWKSVGNFLVLERRGAIFSYEYKLVNIRGINPWLLPTLSGNPQLTREAAVCWYRGSKGRCYLKKTGHPKLELKMFALSTGMYPLP